MKKVSIVGGSPTTCNDAPFDDESWEIWSLGNRVDKCPRIDRIFEIHDYIDQPNPDDYAKWLVSLGKPLVVGEKFKYKADNVYVYPYGAVEEMMGDLYLTSSPANMIAMALMEGYDNISIYGVDMSIDNHEYYHQKPCIEFWVGYARGKGVNVYIPEKAHICRSKYIEGRHWFKDSSDGENIFSESEFSSMAGKHNQKNEELAEQKRQLELKQAAHDGARQVYEQLAKVARAKEANIDVKTLDEAKRIV